MYKFYRKYMDILSGGFMIVVAILYFIASFGIRKLTVSRIGAAFVPQLIAFCTIILGGIVVINGIKRIKVNEALLKVEEENGESNGQSRKYAILGTILLLLVYVSALQKIGFIIMTAIYLFIQFNILSDEKSRKLPLFGIISVGIAVSVYFLFVKAFNLMLPAGILG